MAQKLRQTATFALPRFDNDAGVNYYEEIVTLDPVYLREARVLRLWWEVDITNISAKPEEKFASVGVAYANYPDAHWLVEPREYGFRRLDPSPQTVFEDTFDLHPVPYESGVSIVFRTAHRNVNRPITFRASAYFSD